MNPLASFTQIDYYSQHFTDTTLWTPFVLQVCHRHNLFPCASVRVGIPGTFPTFIVEDCWVIKFYGELFDGYRSFVIEKSVSDLVSVTSTALPVPELIAEGFLFASSSEWPWPYLIFAFLPGASIGGVYSQVKDEDKFDLAHDLGRWIKYLHAINPLTTPIHLPDENQTSFHLPLPSQLIPYPAFLEQRRQQCAADHRAWGALPAHLIEQIDAFLPPAASLVPPHPRQYLIHADLTNDHILGSLVNGRWKTSGIIDFGDAMLGDIYYELVALYLDSFAYDRQLLAAFLESYGVDEWLTEDFRHKAMTCTLLHRFNVLENLSAHFPESESLTDLNKLAELLW